MNDLEKLFSLEKLNKASAIFDYKKLYWFNGNYIRKKSDDVFFFSDIKKYTADDLLPKKTDKIKTVEILTILKELLEDFNNHSDEENEQLFRKKAEEINVKLGNFLLPLRVAITGSRVSPPLFESIRLLGTQKAVNRINDAISLFE